MRRIIVMGHGGYAEGVKQNLKMIVGAPEHMYFIDLEVEDDLSVLEHKVTQLLDRFASDDEVLFACDLLGASPFRVAAMRCVSRPGQFITVAGLNTMAYIELTMESDVSLEALADQVIATTKEAVMKFPQ